MDLSRYSPVGGVGRLLREERGASLGVGAERFRVEVLRPDLLRIAPHGSETRAR